MALVAGAGKIRVVLMRLIVAMVPAGPRWRLAAGSSKMALRTRLAQFMAVRTTVQRHIAVKQLAFFIQPDLSENMIGTLSVAVMAGVGTGVEDPLDTVTFVADAHVCLQSRMLILTVNPAGFIGNPAAVGAEMTRITPGNIFRALKIVSVADETGCCALVDDGNPMEPFGFQELRIVP